MEVQIMGLFDAKIFHTVIYVLYQHCEYFYPYYLTKYVVYLVLYLSAALDYKYLELKYCALVVPAPNVMLARKRG